MHDELVKKLRMRANLFKKINQMENCIMDEAADAIEELIAKLNHADDQIERFVEAAEERRWIPVEEQLPPVDKEVLVVAYESMMRIWNIHRLDPETADVCWECEDGTLDDVCVVTHWMPLPEPPKEG